MYYYIWLNTKSDKSIAYIDTWEIEKLINAGSWQESNI